MYKKEIQINNKKIVIEIGQLAKQANSSVLLSIGATTVLSTIVISKEPTKEYSILPLLVDYRERHYAAGKIPGGFFKREGRPRERETFISRLIDRSIRPLIPIECDREIQVNTLVLSCDGENDTDVAALISTFIALLISEVPQKKIVSGIKVSKIGDEFVVCPSFVQQEKAELNLIIVGDGNEITMLDLNADEADEETIMKAISHSQGYLRKLCEFEEEIKNDFLPKKLEFSFEETIRNNIDGILSLYDENLLSIFRAETKNERQKIITEITSNFLEKISQETEQNKRIALLLFEKKFKEKLRNHILENKIRFDKRSYDQIRPISCQVGVLPRSHGSAIFTRGETQALVTTTLGTFQDMQIVDGLEGEGRERFLFHYNFPGFATGEIKPDRAPSRREIGHGLLARKSLFPVLPKEDDFPYTVRIVSDILESNGSSSMASVCGGSLSLFDAGVPVKSAVAGVALGLIKNSQNYAILSDIIGLEDQIGDMDLKIAGTFNGINAIQLDLKIPGINLELLSEAFLRAKKNRIEILKIMKEVIPLPRSDVSNEAPRIKIINIPVEKIGEVIGPAGKNIKQIIEQTNTKIEIQTDGKTFIAGPTKESVEMAEEAIKPFIEELIVGKVYKGKVKRVTDWGAFVEIFPGKEGLLHISQIANFRIKNIKDFVNVGDEIFVKVIEIEPSGRFFLSRKGVAK